MDLLSVVGRLSRCHHLETIFFVRSSCSKPNHASLRNSCKTQGDVKPGMEGMGGTQVDGAICRISYWQCFLRPFVSAASCSQLSKISRQALGKPMCSYMLRVAEDLLKTFFLTKKPSGLQKPPVAPKEKVGLEVVSLKSLATCGSNESTRIADTPWEIPWVVKFLDML